MRIVTIKVPEELLERIDEYIKKNPGISSRSELFRKAVQEYLMKQEQETIIQKQYNYQEEILVILDG